MDDKAGRKKREGSAPIASFRNLKDVPLLSREEEADLARRYRETKDPKIARRLVESHLRLVIKMARQCSSRPALLPDLIQEGCLGVMRAIEKFDPDRGIRLSSYAAWWIRAFMYQYIMANARMVRVATTFTQRKLFFNLNREQNRFEAAGQTIDPKEIATRLNVPEEAVVEMTTRLSGREVQFDVVVATEPSSDAFSSYAPPRPDEDFERRQLQEAVAQRLKHAAGTLEGRDRQIFDERLLAEKPITLRELGDRLGVSRERARQLEERVKGRLRVLLQDFNDTEAGQPPARAARAA